MLTAKETPLTNATGKDNAWRSFNNGVWQDQINVRDFIQKNYTPYSGDYSFLKGPTSRTDKLWGELKELLTQETEVGGVLDADTKVVGTVASHGGGSPAFPPTSATFSDSRKCPLSTALS